MVIITWRLLYFPRRLRDALCRKVSECILTFHSLTYNEHMNQSYAIDVLLEPMFWFVDNFAKYVGKAFIFCVTVLTSTVVVIAYWVGLPYWIERNPYFTVILMILGHLILWNIVFHYYKGITTPPGYPPSGELVEEAAGFCNKCISPKPPRTHHCSVCDKCILAMDHHCPWLNNCVGYFNRRYFYLYMVYMVIGVVFVIIAGLDIGYVVLWLNDTGGIGTDSDPDLEGVPVMLNQSGVFVPVSQIPEYDYIIRPREHHLPVPIITEAQIIAADPWKRKAVLFMALICLMVLFALGALVIMHGKNISRGETSVESYINETHRKNLGKSFRNPYNFGLKKNWKLFLGLTNGRTFFWNVIIPSGHKPTGSGLTWHTVNSDVSDWP